MMPVLPICGVCLAGLPCSPPTNCRTIRRRPASEKEEGHYSGGRRGVSTTRLGTAESARGECSHHSNPPNVRSTTLGMQPGYECMHGTSCFGAGQLWRGERKRESLQRKPPTQNVNNVAARKPPSYLSTGLKAATPTTIRRKQSRHRRAPITVGRKIDTPARGRLKQSLAK